jgi:multimeric flavodoxin WrbA/Zn ribbon nucleic-acid-binding protein
MNFSNLRGTTMKILGVSGGYTNGTNDAMAKEALMGAQQAGADIEFIHLLNLNIKPCTGCMSCVTGPDGIMNGGSGKCIIKDDLPWFEDKYYDADGIIFVLPVFEKGIPGFFKCIQDRICGPGHDIGMLTVAKSIRQQKNITTGNGPDMRAFKKRVAAFISIGGSDWVCKSASDLYLFAMTPMLNVIDNVTFSWAKSIIMDDQRIAAVHQIGVRTATAALHSDRAKFLGDPGICPNCHSRDMHIYESSQHVECVVCGIIGELVIHDKKIKFEFGPEQYQKAHNTVPGKMKHVEDIGKLEGKFAAERETPEYQARMAKYRSFMQPSIPPKK